MSAPRMFDTSLLIIFTLAFMTYCLGDVISTYVALHHNMDMTEGLSVTSAIISAGMHGYLILLILKTLGLAIFMGMAAYGWWMAMKWTLLGFFIYGSYLTASNICVFFLGFPLLPPGDQASMMGYIWMMVLPFLIAGVAFETLDAFKIMNGETEGHGIWGKELRHFISSRRKSQSE